MNKHFDRTLALAAIFQAASLVKELAWTGRLSNEHFAASIESLLKIDADSVIDIYGSPDKLSLGLQSLIQLLTNNKIPKDPEIARYTISLMHLERSLMKKQHMLNIIKKGVVRAKSQANIFSITHENVIANLASLYTDTLSTFRFRIHITGEANLLNNSNIANKARALLLAGIRATVLWRQLDGSRWQLVFSKKSIVAEAKYLLDNGME